MPKHGERVEINIGATFPINVCSNEECEQKFVLLNYREGRSIWEQVANGAGKMYCPYCGELMKGVK
jgi:hypothetical protein